MSSDSFDLGWTVVSTLIRKQTQNNQHIVENNIFKFRLNSNNNSVAKGLRAQQGSLQNCTLSLSQLLAEIQTFEILKAIRTFKKYMS